MVPRAYSKQYKAPGARLVSRRAVELITRPRDDEKNRQFSSSGARVGQCARLLAYIERKSDKKHKIVATQKKFKRFDQPTTEKATMEILWGGGHNEPLLVFEF